MKINLKKKVMLALLAGGMLCMGQGSADNVNVWYGSGSPAAWKYVSVSVPPYPFNLTDACKTGANFTIEDGTTVGGIALSNVQLIYGGHSGGTDLVTGNSITFNTTDTTTINALLIHSGYTANGTAKGNSMTINGGTFSSSLYSGYSGSGTAEGNSMTINGGTLAGGAVCGYVDSGNGTVKGNLLTVNSGTFGGPIHGGYINSGNATAEDNLVIINGGTFNNSVYGGSGKSGDAKGNSLNINGGTFNDWIYSGRSDSGDAINNAVTIEDGIFNSSAIVSGGYSYGGKAGGTIPERGNKVTINGGTFNGAKISGATGDSSTAEGNNVTVNGGTFNSDSEIYGGDSYFGAVTNNTVTINGGIFDGTDIYGGHKHFSGSECVQGNILTISAGTFDSSSFYGGNVNGDGSAIGNKIVINGGTFGDNSYFCGGNVNGDGSAIGNEIVINGGTFGADSRFLCGCSDDVGSITENKIMINGGYFGTGCGFTLATSAELNPADGTMTVKGGVFGNSCEFKGSRGGGNTFDLQTVIAGTVAEIKNFQNMNFTIPAGATSDTVMMRVGSSYPLAVSGITFTTALNGLSLADGEYITLVKGVDDTGFVATDNLKILDIGGVKELVYTNGTPVVKADYTIKQGGVKGESGITGSYTGSICGNTDGADDGSGTSTPLNVTGGTLSDTRYSGNELIVRRGNYDFGENSEGFFGASTDGTGKLNVNNNTVEIFDATIVDLNDGATFIAGGENGSTGTDGDKGTASYNKVIIHNLAITDSGNISIVGGICPFLSDNKGTTEGNSLKIENFSAGSANVMVAGASTYIGIAKDNTVELANGKYMMAVGGMTTATGDVIKNHVIIHGGDYELSGMMASVFPCTVAGGLGMGSASGNGKAEENTVLIESGNFKGNIAGGYLAENIVGYAKGNSVMIKDGTFAGSGYPAIYGGYADKGDVYENNVEIKGGNFIGNSWGIFEFYGGYGYTANAVGTEKIYKNSVKVSGGSITQSRIYGGYGKGEVYENDVEITGGVFGQASTVTGGMSEIGGASRNTVDISNAAFAGGGAGDGVEISGGCVMGANDAIQNIVNIHSGSFGVEDVINIVAGVSDGGDAAGNKLNIEKGAFGDGTAFVGGTGVNATENEVNIFGGSFGNDIKLIGGCSNGGTSSNNTLNLKIKMSGKAEMIGYFQNMNFTLPAGIAKDDVMLKTATLFVDNNGGEATINVYAANGVKLKAGDVITLIESNDTADSDTFTGGDVLGGAGEVTIDGENLILTLLRDFEQKKSAGSEDQQKAPVEGIAAAVQTVNMSADLASGQGMSSLLANTAGGTTNTFGAMSAGSSKYKTGSHVDVDGWGVIVGAGKTRDWKDGSATTYGLFFEYGKGDFDTYNGNVHGDGNSENKGVGIMVRHKLTNNTYYEGNIRFGKQETEWGESELGSYDTDSKYYGIMVGMGHIFPAGKNEIDVYGRYTYGHVGACDAKVGDSHYNFESVKSHRVRLGAKYNFVQEKSNAKPFIGLAWEHEFKGESKASIAGVGEAPAPSMKGHTGIMEVGCDWDVSKKWTVGLGTNAYIGKRKGWDGMARVFYNF